MLCMFLEPCGELANCPESTVNKLKDYAYSSFYT